jgi:hypothetical protein
MAERPPDHHVGVAPDDPRNRAPIAYFKPKPVTADSARASLRQALPHATDGDVEARVERLLQKIATGPIKSDPPLSQSLAEVDDPWYGLGTHPDIIEHMWGVLGRSGPRSSADRRRLRRWLRHDRLCHAAAATRSGASDARASEPSGETKPDL